MGIRSCRIRKPHVFELDGNVGGCSFRQLLQTRRGVDDRLRPAQVNDMICRRMGFGGVCVLVSTVACDKACCRPTQGKSKKKPSRLAAKDNGDEYDKERLHAKFPF